MVCNPGYRPGWLVASEIDDFADGERLPDAEVLSHGAIPKKLPENCGPRFFGCQQFSDPLPLIGVYRQVKPHFDILALVVIVVARWVERMGYQPFLWVRFWR